MQILLSLLNIIDLACKPNKTLKIAAAITNKKSLNCDQVVEYFMREKHLLLSMIVVVLFVIFISFH